MKNKPVASPRQKPRPLSLPERRAYRRLEDVVGCKWSAAVLAAIGRGVTRPGQLERFIPGISTKVLNERLRKLLDYELVTRAEFPAKCSGWNTRSPTRAANWRDSSNSSATSTSNTRNAPGTRRAEALRRGADRLGASRTGPRLRDLAAEASAKAVDLPCHAQSIAEDEALKRGWKKSPASSRKRVRSFTRSSITVESTA